MTDQFNPDTQRDIPEQAAREAERLKTQAKNAIDSATQRAKEHGRQTAQDAKERVGQQADKLANAERAAANQLRQDDLNTLARYAEQVADSIHQFAGQIRRKSVDEIIHDVSDFGRKNPALFIAGSVAVGAVLMRFAKSSEHHEHEELARPERAGSFTETRAGSFETEVPTVTERVTSPQPNSATTSARTRSATTPTL